jgi:tetratricopeptide (TPR) repeat protein
MSKKPTQQKESKPVKQQLPQPSGVAKQNLRKKDFHKRNLWLLFLFGFLLYANTIPFKYALDDKLAITENQFTKKGFAGIADHLTHEMFTGFFGKQKNLVEGGRYRPLSMITFAVEWQLFGENPYISHFLNAVLYGLTAILLYLVLLKIFPSTPSPLERGKGVRPFLTFPFIVTALFIAHPLHTEVVANIKSRDEIMSFLGALAALYFIFRFLENKKPLHLVLSGAVFFLALCSKESAITFIGVMAVTLIFFPKGTLKENIVAVAPMVAGAFAYLLIRKIVLGDMVKGHIALELMNDPFLKAEAGEKTPTILYTMLLYIKLLIFPHPLTHDYYPWYPLADESYKWGAPFPYLNWSSMKAIAGLLVYLALIIYGVLGLIKAIQKKEKNIIAYGVLIYLGTFILFSNLFFTIGTFMNERFMYMPSLGFAIILGYIICPYTPSIVGKVKNVAMMQAVLIILLVAYSAKTIARNGAWRDDYSLSTTDVQTSTTSSKVQMSAGGALIDKSKEFKNPAEKQQMLTEAVLHLHRSLELYPTYIAPLLLSGNAYFELGDFNSSIIYFDNCLKVDSEYKYALNNLLLVADTCSKTGKFDIAIKALNTLVSHNRSNAQAYMMLGEIYGKNLHNTLLAEENLNKALAIEPNNTNAMQKLGVTKAMEGDAKKAAEIFNRALEIEPNNALIMMNLGITYFNLGDSVKGKEFMAKAQKIDPSLKR